jgi:hypothetical protein
MIIPEYPKRTDGKYYGRKPVERLWLSWEGSVRRDCLLLLNVRRVRRLVQYKNLWRPSTERSEPNAGCWAIEEE